MLPLVSYTNEVKWIVLGTLYSKARGILAMGAVHLYGEKFVFSITAWYIAHMLNKWGHYASHSKSDYSTISLFKN